MPRPLRRNRGFTYLGLIILVAIIGLVSAAGLKMGSLLQRSAAEQELLDIGAAFSDALKSYAGATPAGQPQQPANLKDLLKDPRFPYTRRHLRKLFTDPITGKAEWGLLYLSGTTGIVGVYSLSHAQPIKVGNFDARFQGFEGQQHLSDWQFTIGGLAPLPLSSPPAAVPETPAPAELLPPAPEQEVFSEMPQAEKPPGETADPP